MIHHLSGHLTISGFDGQMIAPEPTLAKKLTPMPILIPSTPVTDDSHLSTLSDPPSSYTTYLEDDRGRVVEPYLDSSNSSCESSPLSSGPKTPPDKDSSVPLAPEGKPNHIDFINPLDIKIEHDEICIHCECERT